MDEQKCREFLAMPTVNPITKRTIMVTPGKGTYGKLEKECLRIIGTKPTVAGATSPSTATPAKPVLTPAVPVTPVLPPTTPSQSSVAPFVYKPGLGGGPIKATTPGYLKPAVATPVIGGQPLASIAPIIPIGGAQRPNLLPITPTVATPFIPRAGPAPIITGLANPNPLIATRVPAPIGGGLVTPSPFVAKPGLTPIGGGLVIPSPFVAKPGLTPIKPVGTGVAVYSEDEDVNEIANFIEETMNSYDYERLSNMYPEDEDFEQSWDDFLEEQKERVRNLSEDDIEFANTLMDFITSQKVVCMDKEGGMRLIATGFYIDSDDRFVIFNDR